MDEYIDSEIVQVPEDIEIYVGLKIVQWDWTNIKKIIPIYDGEICRGKVYNGFFSRPTTTKQRIYKWRKYEKN